MPVKSRTLHKVQYIVFLLGEGYSYKCSERGKYSILYHGLFYRIPTTVIWRNTPDECVSKIKENLFGLSRLQFFEKSNIKHLVGKEYETAHRQTNEDYLRYLEEAI